MALCLYQILSKSIKAFFRTEKSVETRSAFCDCNMYVVQDAHQITSEKASYIPLAFQHEFGYKDSSCKLRFLPTPHLLSPLSILIGISQLLSLGYADNTTFFPWKWAGSSTQAWVPAFYVSILRIPRLYEFGERRWNNIDRGKPKNSEKNLYQCHFVHHKSHMDWPWRETGPPLWEAGD
jgi:hypothetical protein